MSRFGVTLGSLKVVDSLAPEDMKRPGRIKGEGP